jgi:hypothetical protein
MKIRQGCVFVCLSYTVVANEVRELVCLVELVSDSRKTSKQTNEINESRTLFVNDEYIREQLLGQTQAPDFYQGLPIIDMRIVIF